MEWPDNAAPLTDRQGPVVGCRLVDNIDALPRLTTTLQGASKVPGEERRVSGDQTEQQGGPARPLDFSTFLLSLGTSALVQLGEAPDPTQGGKPCPDLAGAKQSIDLLGLLEAKTKGNLETGEERLLQSLLSDLRLRFVKASQRSCG
jgi:hypothetical protein